MQISFADTSSGQYASDFELFLTRQLNFEALSQYFGGSPYGGNHGSTRIDALGDTFGQSTSASQCNQWTSETSSSISSGFTRFVFSMHAIQIACILPRNDHFQVALSSQNTLPRQYWTHRHRLLYVFQVPRQESISQHLNQLDLQRYLLHQPANQILVQLINQVTSQHLNHPIFQQLDQRTSLRFFQLQVLQFNHPTMQPSNHPRIHHSGQQPNHRIIHHINQRIALHWNHLTIQPSNHQRTQHLAQQPNHRIVHRINRRIVPHLNHPLLLLLSQR